MTGHLDHPLGRIEVTRKPIRNLYLRLGSDPAVIRVSAPRRLADRDIQAFVTSREHWIRRQRERLARRPPRIEPDRLPAGLHLLGQPYRLVTRRDRDQHGKVQVHDDRLLLSTADDDSASAREALQRHCRARLKDILSDRVPWWAREMGLPVPEWRIRRMKTRWGSCNIRDRRIWLNLELVRMPVEVIDLVVVHELAHLIERGHNARFYAVMDRHYPAWREHEPELDHYGIIGL